MCGIIGFAGNTEAVPILLDGLERLEYRGYDSAGVAVASPEGRLQVKKCKGRLGVLREALAAQKLFTLRFRWQEIILQRRRILQRKKFM